MKEYYLTFGGLEQYFMEYEAGNDKPVLLYVHGGPGRAESLIGWEIDGRIGKDVNLVFYDQRGAGRTYYKNAGEMPTYEQVYSDLCEIVKYFKQKYKKKLFIMGHGWGTVPAIRYVRENPDMVAGYIGYAQCVDYTRVGKVRCDRVLELAKACNAKGDIKAVEKLSEKTGGTFHRDMLKKGEITKLNKLLTKYNVAYGTDRVLMKKIPASPTYMMFDLKILINCPKINVKLSEYYKHVNLYEESMEYSVPLMFISGDWDYQDPYIMVQDYASKVKAPMVEMKLVEDGTVSAMFDKSVEFWASVKDFIVKCANS